MTRRRPCRAVLAVGHSHLVSRRRRPEQSQQVPQPGPSTIPYDGPNMTIIVANAVTDLLILMRKTKNGTDVMKSTALALSAVPIPALQNAGNEII